MISVQKQNTNEHIISEMLHDKKILVVDDDDDYAEALDEVFSLQGAKVTRVTDPVAGFGCALSSSFDLIIVDKNMPRLSGVEFAEKIRQEIPGAKVVLITAYPDENSKRRCVDVGVGYYLPKPFRKNDILEACSFLFL